MTTNACAKCGFYPENPSARLWKAIAFAGGFVLGLYSGPLHAAPSSGGDAVQGLYDALLGTMKSGKALGPSPSAAPQPSRNYRSNFRLQLDHADMAIAGFRLRRNQLEAEKSDEPAHD